MKQDGHAPLPSERTLFAIWDAIERVRNREGETAAHQLARIALAALMAALETLPAGGVERQACPDRAADRPVVNTVDT